MAYELAPARCCSAQTPCTGPSSKSSDERVDGESGACSTLQVPAALACPGGCSARRDVSLEGGSKCAALYEVAGDGICDAPEFHAVRGFMELTPDVGKFMRQRRAPLAAVHSAA